MAAKRKNVSISLAAHSHLEDYCFYNGKKKMYAVLEEKIFELPKKTGK